VKINPEYSGETPFYKRVKELAQYLYVLRGCQNNRSLEYWLEAEQRLKESMASERRKSEKQKYHSN
jgi:hypothetical protein